MTARSDLDLTAAAAKAAGIDFALGVGMNNGRPGFTPRSSMCWQGWDPLNDDGDSQRLAIKLRMQTRADDYGCAARIGDDGRWHGFEAHLHGGHERAMRRAVVTAAAVVHYRELTS